MGMTWRTMPLLSTLAALVIIVHSAEDNVDRDYRFDLQPRALDTATPNYDQPWRSLEEQSVPQPTHLDVWQDSPEEPLKRRRPVRKRKRRPLPSSEELSEKHIDERPEVIRLYPDNTNDKPQLSQEQIYHDNKEQIRYRDTEYVELTSEMPRRRRKRPENRRNRWTEDYLDIERPLRRRGQRRKRPSVEGWPRLSEFDEYRPNEESREANKDKLKEHFTTNHESEDGGSRRDDYNTDYVDKRRTEPTEIPEFITTVQDSEMHLLPEKKENYQMKEDKSLSEFSMEMSADKLRRDGEENEQRDDYKLPLGRQLDEQSEKNPFKWSTYLFGDNLQNFTNNKNKNASLNKEDVKQIIKNKHLKQKIEEKFNGSQYENIMQNKEYVEHNNKTKSKDLKLPLFTFEPLHQIMFDDEDLNLDNRPIDPITLKEILKRSNGTSLSEILQQHNMSLSDLLYGKEEAISLLKSEGFMDRYENRVSAASEKSITTFDVKNENLESTEGRQIYKEIDVTTETTPETNQPVQTIEVTTKVTDLESQSTGRETSRRNETIKSNTPKISNKRRFQNVRRKLRMRPVVNNNYKGQLNRDLIALTARKYKQSRNVTKSKEWKYVIPLMNGTDISYEINTDEVTKLPSTTTPMPDDTTTISTTEYYSPTTIIIDIQTETSVKDAENDVERHETTSEPTTTTQETTTNQITTTTNKPKSSRMRQGANRLGLRRQAFNNRLKRKRLKQKNSTTSSPTGQEDPGLDLFGMPNLVSSSEFIAKTQTPKTTKSNADDEDFTTLDDFITTESARHLENGPRFTRNSSIPETELKSKQDLYTAQFSSTTEDTAKFEIEEILNDTRTSAKLSRILMERNMTLNELVEHRERGSSHVHLADIFHNASKEPNPPEPFLSKSLIEPISKETYPLRALLEANLHDPKATTIDPNPIQTQYINIPVVMDFGNNVNENGENMGIMSLFNKFTDTDITSVEKSEIGKDSEGTPYVTTVIALNDTSNEKTSESRVLNDNENHLKHDIVGWNALFELMRKTQQNYSNPEMSHDEDPDLHPKIFLHDSDGDGLIALDDLENIKAVDNSMALPEANLNLNPYERNEVPVQPGILDRAPSNTRSVTVATASIVGLAMVLFLLTYAVFKWKQQRNLLQKKRSFSDERIPTPVFENRKSHKNNCSTRSISPMLATSNIYTMSTLDSTGKESPDYMWDSLRKPFQ